MHHRIYRNKIRVLHISVFLVNLKKFIRITFLRYIKTVVDKHIGLLIRKRVSVSIYNIA